jgi:hypothetical protein
MGSHHRLHDDETLMRAAAFLLAAVICGCAVFPLQEAECRGVNWRQRGYADGLSGTYRQDLRLVPECKQRYGVDVQVEEYLAGWRDGHDEWDRLIGSMDRRR